MEDAMVTLPLVVVLGFTAFALVKWGKQKVSGLVVGVLFGLVLASTAVGPPIVNGLTTVSSAMVKAISSAVS
ncbi:MAG TPA: hypothetical protein VFP89_15115 [Propionibacteriaceae bacterium]|nr:hypothetical protein [Propionibacteriaceae bacterium]